MKVWIVVHTYEYNHQLEVFDTEEKAKACMRKILDQYEKEYNQKIPDGNKLLEISDQCHIEIEEEEVQ